LQQPAAAAVTGLVFAGGCPQDVSCNGQDSNATETNVAAILGVSESLVTQIGVVDNSSPTNLNFAVSPLGALSGTWSISNPDITHLAFKADTYFILGEVTAPSGEWMMDTSAPGSWDITLVNCPDAICGGGGRPYVTADFLNNGGQIAELSNVRAFAVVPVPAALWLFGSAMGLLRWVRRRVS
jgi:hypothetical protein